MFRVIQRGMAGLLALLLLCVLASGVLGQALPPAPVLVSILLPREEQRPARIRGLDLVYGGRFERYVPGGRGFAWSPEGCRIVLQGLSGEDRALRLVDIPGGHSHRYPVPVTRLTAWSPEGRRLVISTPPGAEAGLYIAAAGEYGLQTLPLPDAREEVFQFLWSPDASRAILVTRNTGRTRYRSHLVEVASLSVTHLPALDLDMSFAVPVGLDTPLWSWSPDGQYVAAYRGEGLLRLHLASGEQQSLAGVQAFDAIVGFAWLPDSSAIALFGVPAITAGIAANSATTVSIDTAGDAGLYQGYLWPVGANRLVATGVSTTTLPPLLWSPDRRHILEYTASHTRILSVTDGRVVLDIPHRRIMSSGNLWSPDGRYLVLSSAHVDKTLRIIDVQQGRIMEQPAGGGTLEWSPTGDFFTMYNPVQRQLEITPLNDAGVGRGWRLPVEGQARLCYPAVAR